MNFLSRFKAKPMAEPDLGDHDAGVEFAAPVRRRTFSASQYREEELARAAAGRAAIAAAESEAAAAAEEGRLRRLAEAEAERADEAGEAADRPALDPMDWEEAVGWLSQRSAEARNFVASAWNWEHDLRVLQFLVAQPDMDKGVAAGIFWLTGATDDFFPWGDDDCPDDPQFRRASEMVDALGRRFDADDFASCARGFDDSWDCSQLRQRLEELYMAGRIDWSPANIPVNSPGPCPVLADVPEDERGEVRDFLVRHGAY